VTARSVCVWEGESELRLHQLFPTSGRDPHEGRGRSDVGWPEGFVENSIIMKKIKIFIYIQTD
jgi:hypothetical protein